MGSGNLSCLIRELIKCTSAWFPKNRSDDTFHRISRRGIDIIRQMNIFRKVGFLPIIFLCWSDFCCCFFVPYGSIMCNALFYLGRVIFHFQREFLPHLNLHKQTTVASCLHALTEIPRDFKK